MRIVIDHVANEHAYAYCNAAQSGNGHLEIAGMIEGNAVKGSNIYVKNLYLLGVLPFSGKVLAGEQDLSTAHVDIPADHLAAWYDEWIRSGRSPSDIIGWWHSHGSGTVFQSPQDRETTYERFNKRRFAVALTFNTEGKIYGEVTVFDPFYHRIESIDVEIAYPVVDVDVSAVAEIVKMRKRPVKGLSLNDLSPAELKSIHRKMRKGGYPKLLANYVDDIVYGEGE